MKTSAKTVAARALKTLKKLESLKEEMNAHYELLDMDLDELKKLKFKSDGKIAIVDNFAEKNHVYRTTSVRRFEIKRLK